MEEDDALDGKENGASSFQVIADQKAEQDYAINTFKGSGAMSEIFDAKDPNEEKNRKAEINTEI